MNAVSKLKVLSLGHSIKDAEAGISFTVNPVLVCDAVHEGGRIFKKGVTYDAIKERIPASRLKRMMQMKMGSANFFIKTRGARE